MDAVAAILKKEVKSYFASPIAYVVLTFFLILGGCLYYQIFTRQAQQTNLVVTRNWFTPLANEDDGTYVVMRDFHLTLAPFLFFLLPLITMGSFAGERRRGTMELLSTTPASNWTLVAGKFVAALVFFLFTVSPTLLYNIVLFIYGDVQLGMAFSSYLGLLLFASAVLALGIFISSLTESQALAAMATFGLGFLLYLLDIVARKLESDTGDILAYVSFSRHFEGFARGLIGSADIVFFFSITLLGLFFTLRSLEAVRWKA